MNDSNLDSRIENYINTGKILRAKDYNGYTVLLVNMNGGYSFRSFDHGSALCSQLNLAIHLLKSYATVDSIEEALQ